MLHKFVLHFAIVATYFGVANSLEIFPVGKLPAPLDGAGLLYDGDDSVYLLGGMEPNGIQNKILRYELSTGDFEVLGILPMDVNLGVTGQKTTGEIFYFGGRTYDYGEPDPYPEHPVWKLSKTFGNPENITIIQNHEMYATIAPFSDKNWYIFGGTFNDGDPSPFITKFSIETESLIVVAELPMAVIAPTAVVYGEDIYIFGGNGSALDNETDHVSYITKFTPANNKVEKLNLSLHLGIAYASAVTAENEIYIIGGARKHLNETEEHNVSRFNPRLNTVEYLNVTNLPIPTGWSSPPVVYVPKSNRIYTFGGYDEDIGGPIDDIFYFQLDNKANQGSSQL